MTLNESCLDEARSELERGSVKGAVTNNRALPPERRLPSAHLRSAYYCSQESKQDTRRKAYVKKGSDNSGANQAV